MEVVKGFPPNIIEIRKHLKPPKGAIFCYGSKVYNPSGGEIPPDIELHEHVHIKQQSAYTSPEVWWAKYLLDVRFRRLQELEAYSKQYRFVKDALGAKAAKECLDELSDNMSSPQYKLEITKHQAETMIRKSI